jgi:hypothetical protein
MKLSAWIVTLIGVLLVLAELGVIALTDAWVAWVIALAVLIMGVKKLMVSYGKMGTYYKKKSRRG